jgi:hypothetical protein
MNRSITFNLSDKTQADAFGNLVRALNQAGVPWGIDKCLDEITVNISEGY